MKALRNHKSLITALAILAVLVIGAVAYLNVTNDKPKKSSGQGTSSHKKAPDIKPGTKGPTITSPDPIPPSGPAAGPAAPKAADQ